MYLLPHGSSFWYHQGDGIVIICIVNRLPLPMKGHSSISLCRSFWEERPIWFILSRRLATAVIIEGDVDSEVLLFRRQKIGGGVPLRRKWYLAIKVSSREDRDSCCSSRRMKSLERSPARLFFRICMRSWNFHRNLLSFKDRSPTGFCSIQAAYSSMVALGSCQRWPLRRLRRLRMGGSLEAKADDDSLHQDFFDPEVSVWERVGVCRDIVVPISLPLWKWEAGIGIGDWWFGSALSFLTDPQRISWKLSLAGHTSLSLFPVGLSFHYLREQ